MEDNWERMGDALPIGALSLSERPNATTAAPDNSAHPSDVTKPPTPPPAESSPSQPQHQTQQQIPAPAAPLEYETVDAAILQALADPTQRTTVLKCEELVEKFLADPCQETLQFPAVFSSYQRMLAHRVGQYYGLQTSTVDYEDSQGRVVGIRLKNCHDPKPRLRNLDVRLNAIPARASCSNGAGAGVADKPRLLRRQDDDRSQQNSSEHSLNQSPVRSIKERHENYMKAREELGLGSGPQDGMGRGGRGGPGGRYGNGGRMDGGRGRKAVFRDKDKDLSDPDYRRGMNRFTGTARFDPSYAAMPAGGIYQVPTYASEFPALNRMQGGPATSAGRPHMQQHQPQAAHQMPPGAQPISGPASHQQQTAPGPWGQQNQQQAQSGVRPPPPPPPPHQHTGGPAGATAAGANSGPSGKAHRQGSAGGGGAPSGGIGSRQQQQQQQQQQAAAFGPAVTAGHFPGVPGSQYPVQPVQVALGTAGFMPTPHGQPVFSMTTAGAAIPGTMYAAPAPGVSGAFYPGVGMGMSMGPVGMAVPATGAYGYVAAPAPGVGMGVGPTGEAIALAPQAAYPVYASYPAGAPMYPATASAQLAQSAIHHPAGGAAIPMRPMYGIPSFYPQYDPSQYAAGMHPHAQGDGRAYGGYGGHHGHGGGAQQHHGGGHGHGHGGRGRDSDTGAGRGEQHQGAGAGGAGMSGSAADNK